MAKKRVRNGRMFGVDNKDKKFGANKQYVFVYLKNSDGDNELPYLFTSNQIQVARIRAQKNPEDLLKKDRLTDLFD